MDSHNQTLGKEGTHMWTNTIDFGLTSKQSIFTIAYENSAFWHMYIYNVKVCRCVCVCVIHVHSTLCGRTLFLSLFDHSFDFTLL